MVILRATNENGLKVDLDVLENDAPIKLDISAIENATIGDVFGASSQTFSLPGTDKNNQFFGNLFDLGATPAVALQDSIDCQVLTDGQDVFAGKLYITDIVTDQKGYTTYQVNVVNETIDFKFLLTDTLLSELDWSAYNHDYTYNNITASWSGSLFGGDIVYPHVDYGTPEGNTTLPAYVLGGGARSFDNIDSPLQVSQFKPAIRVRTVLDEIFDSVNYKYTSSFIDSAYFENLYMLMTPNDGLGVLNANATLGSVWAFRGTSNQTFNALTVTTINFNAEVYDTENRFDLINDRYTAYTDGLYNFAIAFNYSIANYDINSRPSFRVRLTKNGGTTGPNTTFVEPPASGQIYAPFANIELKNGDFLELQVMYVTDDGSEVITIGFGQNNTYFKALGPQSSGGGEVDMGLQFPYEMKALDFIQGIIEKFNLVIEPTSGFRNLLTIEPFTDWVSIGKIVNWTDKVDRSERFKIVHPITEQPKQINFRDADDEAIHNKYTVDNFGEVFGSYIYENDSDLPIGEREIGKVFAATPVKGIVNGDTMIIPSLCRKDNSGRELPFKFKPRLLFNNGLQDMPVTALGLSGSTSNPGNYFIIDEVSTVHTENKFLQMTTFEYLPTDASGSISGSRDLHFGNLNWSQYFQNVQNGKTTQDAYHVYWAAYINSLYDIDARKLTCNVFLKPTELQGIQLNDQIFIDGAYYRINKISGANLSYRDSVEVELIKELNRLLPYPRRRVLDSIGTAVDIVVREIQADGNVIYEDYNGGVTVDDYGLIQQAGFKDGFAVFNDNNTGSVTWNIPASVTADQSRIAFGENQLEDSVGLVLVAGSNNTVQTQTENSLINGNSNTLNAGSKNATIIGTNNTIDVLTENVSIIGSSNSLVTGPNNNSMLIGGNNTTLTNTDFCVSIEGASGSSILDSDSTTAINSHQNEVIVNGSGHTVIGLNRESVGLDLLNTRNNSNFLGDTYIGGGYLIDSFVIDVGNGTNYFLTGSDYGDGKHETLYLLNWNGVSPGTASIHLPSATNSDYKKVVYTFKLTSGNSGEVVSIIPFDPAQTIDGLTTYETSGSFAFISIHASENKWHIIDNSVGQVGPIGPSGSGICAEEVKVINSDQPDPNEIYYYTSVQSTGSDCQDLNTLDIFGLRYESNTNTHYLETSLEVTGSVRATSFTGSLFGTASFATSASFANTASFALTSSFSNVNLQQVTDNGNVTTNFISSSAGFIRKPTSTTTAFIQLGGLEDNAANVYFQSERAGVNQIRFVSSPSENALVFNNSGSQASRIQFSNGEGEIRAVTNLIYNALAGQHKFYQSVNVGSSGSNTLNGATDSLVVGTNNLINSSSYSLVAGRDNTLLTSGTGESNIILGESNTISNGLKNTIVGGAGHSIADASTGFASIFGGNGNTLGSTGDAQGSTMLGGLNNFGEGHYNELIGGSNNIINVGLGGTPQTTFNGIYGGSSQIIGDTFVDPTFAYIFGGTQNQNQSQHAIMVGGNGNTIAAGSTDSVIVGGTGNNFNASAYSVILGGSFNQIDQASISSILASNSSLIHPNVAQGVIIGGSINQINGSANDAAVVGGFLNNSSHNNSVVIGGNNLSTTADNQVVVPDLRIASSATLFGVGGGAFYTTGSQEYGLDKSILSIESDPGNSGIYTDAFNIFNLEITDTKDSFKVDVDITGSLNVSGSVTIRANEVLTLTPVSTLPASAPTGSFAVSGSTPPKPYFYDGTNWNELY